MGQSLNTPSSTLPRPARRGAVLLEFALVSLALYLLLAAVIGLGRWMATVQAAQDVARIAAREIALFPLGPELTFDQALADPDFQSAIYSPDFLVVDLAANPPEAGLDVFFASMPVVNRALRPLMITSNVDVGGNTRRLLHVPGVITDSPTSPSGLTVVIPRIDSRDAATGVETGITLVDVIEEVRPPGDPLLTSPFRVSNGGLAAIRVNVPYQSATLTAYTPATQVTPQGEPVNTPVLASDPGGGGYRIVGPGPDGAGPYSGTYGLGEQYVLGRSVRPFRRLVSAQALFRREVFVQ